MDKDNDGSGTATFSAFNAPVTVTPPADSDVIAASKLKALAG